MSRAARTFLALLPVGLGLVGWLLVAAPPARAGVWVVSSSAKVFPRSAPTATRSIALSAARNEYEAAQVAVSGRGRRPVTVSWAPGSDPILVGSSELFKVGYVIITRPSTGAGSKPGPYPDPLLPAAFGTAVTLNPGAEAFYVRVHVPPGTPPGTYAGVLSVDDPGLPDDPGYPASPVLVPVSITVWDFTLAPTSLRTSFYIGATKVMRSVRDALPDTDENEATILDKYYRFWADHGISPLRLRPFPSVDASTGHIKSDPGLPGALSPYLGGRDTSPGMFADTCFPLSLHWPWGSLDPTADAGPLSTYLDELFRIYVANGWQDKGYFYVYDEPHPAEERRAGELAKLIHAASEPLGFRARVLLTDWPRPVASGKSWPANTFLFDDIDIWCPSVYRYFDALPALAQRRAFGGETWWYSYATLNPSRFPTFLIDLPLSHERAVPWMTWRWDATGFVYWGTTRWGDPITGDGYRDPYLNPVSYAWRGGWRANGEASLVYPGYEPALGLNDPYAGPVSSLRMEALRDGIEDFEYLRQAGAARRGGTAGQVAAACAKRVAAAISDYRYGASDAAYRNMPVISGGGALFAAARAHLASYITRIQDGLSPVTVTGAVVDGRGRPVAGADVGDGVIHATSDPAGQFQLAGVVPAWRLTVTHPLYAATTIKGTGDDPNATVRLMRSSRVDLLLGFDAGPQFRVTGGSASRDTTELTGGAAAARVVLRGGGATATVSLPPHRRDLRRYRSLGLDVFSPDPLDHAAPWFLRLSVSDAKGHAYQRQFLLRPGAWNRLSLPLQGRGLLVRHLSSVRLQVSRGTHTVVADTLVAR